MENDVVVSIICNAFNHAKYLPKALDSFIGQKTSFRYEIVVHDDCSTDGTADIIRDYCKKYPNLIRPIFEKENQFSKNVSISQEISVPFSKGKYLAFCEGDDYWVDEKKLQKQVNILENDSSVFMCCHSTNRVSAKNGKILNVLRSTKTQDGILMYQDLLSETNFPHLSSIVMRKNDFLKMPSIYKNLPLGDYPLRAYCLASGNVFCIDETMSCYRVMAESSWSKRERFNYDYRYSMNKRMDEFLIEFDKTTDFSYHDYLTTLMSEKDFRTCVFCGRYKEAKQNPCYKKSAFLTKVFVNLGIVFPRVIRWIVSVRSKIVHYRGS